VNHENMVKTLEPRICVDSDLARQPCALARQTKRILVMVLQALIPVLRGHFPCTPIPVVTDRLQEQSWHSPLRSEFSEPKTKLMGFLNST
jgi:hypothetical protein